MGPARPVRRGCCMKRQIRRRFRRQVGGGAVREDGVTMQTKPSLNIAKGSGKSGVSRSHNGGGLRAASFTAARRARPASGQRCLWP